MSWRRGFTIIELLVTLGVVGILGTALARLLINSSRFVSRQEAQMEARLTARAAYNVLSTDLRPLGRRALWQGSASEIRLNVPYEWGVLCQAAAGSNVISMAPTDSARAASAVPAVLAYQQSDGSFIDVQWPTVTASSNAAACDADSIRVLPGGRLVDAGQLVPRPPGTVMRLAEGIWYKFAPSTSLPGRVGLFRQRSPSSYEEVLAPFSTEARFRFLVGPNLTPQDAPPADLSTLTGLELWLIAESEDTPTGAPGPEEFRLITSVKFHNTRM